MIVCINALYSCSLMRIFQIHLCVSTSFLGRRRGEKYYFEVKSPSVTLTGLELSQAGLELLNLSASDFFFFFPAHYQRHKNVLRLPQTVLMFIHSSEHAKGNLLRVEWESTRFLVGTSRYHNQFYHLVVMFTQRT